MHPRLLPSLLIASLSLFSCATLLNAHTISFEPVLKFAYPGAVSTTAQGIDDAGNVVGVYRINFGDEATGFERYADGTFSAPIIFPGSDVLQTVPTAVNNNGTIAGWYNTTPVDSHGFFLANGVYTTFDYPGANYTVIEGINDAGDFVGRYALSDGRVHAFASIGGQFVSITIPQSGYVDSTDINNDGDIVGWYYNFYGIGHNFRRKSDGTLDYHIRLGGTGTLLGTNDTGEIVGQFSESGGDSTGLYYSVGHTVISYTYPDLAYNYFTGISRRGLICGYGFDLSSSINYGYLVRRVITESAE
jgi:uncharacterized membrane protein